MLGELGLARGAACPRRCRRRAGRVRAGGGSASRRSGRPGPANARAHGRAPAWNLQRLERRQRGHRRAPPGAGEQRHLAEDVARAERRHRRRPRRVTLTVASPLTMTNMAWPGPSSSIGVAPSAKLDEMRACGAACRARRRRAPRRRRASTSGSSRGSMAVNLRRCRRHDGQAGKRAARRRATRRPPRSRISTGPGDEAVAGEDVPRRVAPSPTAEKIGTPPGMTHRVGAREMELVEADGEEEIEDPPAAGHGDDAAARARPRASASASGASAGFHHQASARRSMPRRRRREDEAVAAARVGVGLVAEAAEDGRPPPRRAPPGSAPSRPRCGVPAASRRRASAMRSSAETMAWPSIAIAGRSRPRACRRSPWSTSATIFAADRLDLLVGQRPLGRLQRHLDGDRLLALAERARPRRRRRPTTPAISLRSAPSAARTTFAASTPRSTTKAKSRRTGCRSESVERRLGLGRPRLRRRDRVEDQLEAGERALGVERLEHLRVELAERADDGLRALADRAGAAGMEPGRRVGDDLHLVGREAERVEERQRIGLGVEDARPARPCADQWRPRR